jgi:hypothetical protein
VWGIADGDVAAVGVGQLQVTTDGGKTWRTAIRADHLSVTGLAFIGRRHVVVLGGAPPPKRPWDLDPLVFRSDDGGRPGAGSHRCCPAAPGGRSRLASSRLHWDSPSRLPAMSTTATGFYGRSMEAAHGRASASRPMRATPFRPSTLSTTEPATRLHHGVAAPACTEQTTGAPPGTPFPARASTASRRTPSISSIRDAASSRETRWSGASY